MKHLLVVNFETHSKITSWDILPSERGVGHFLDICLEDLKGAVINGFTCVRLDGQDLTQAIEECVTVAEGDEVLRTIGSLTSGTSLPCTGLGE